MIKKLLRTLSGIDKEDLFWGIVFAASAFILVYCFYIAISEADKIQPTAKQSPLPPIVVNVYVPEYKEPLPMKSDGTLPGFQEKTGKWRKLK